MESSAYWSTITLTILKQLGIVFAVLIGMAVLYVGYLKVSLKNKVYCIFLEPTKELSGELIRLRQTPKDARPVLTSGVDQQEYLMDLECQFQVTYPAGVPAMMREKVPAQMYQRGQSLPVNLLGNGHTPGSSSAVLKLIRNVSVAGELIERMNDELGENRLKLVQQIVVGASVIMVAGLGAVGYLVFRIYQIVEAMRGALGA